MNKEGLALLKEFEGVKLKAYMPTPNDVPTIGYGHTEGVKMGDTITKAQAEAWLKKDVLKYESGVEEACKIKPNENELAAMTCLAFNIGLGWKGATRPKGAKKGFRQSSVLAAHNRADSQSASRAFSMWNEQAGVALPGLTRRRAAEAALYLKPTPETQADYAMPQTVDAEKSAAKSPIGIMGGVTSATGALGVVSSIGGQANDAAGAVGGVVSTIKTGREWATNAAAAIGFTPLELFCIVLVVVGGVVMYFRWRQKRAGFA